MLLNKKYLCMKKPSISFILLMILCAPLWVSVSSYKSSSASPLIPRDSSSVKGIIASSTLVNNIDNSDSIVMNNNRQLEDAADDEDEDEDEDKDDDDFSGTDNTEETAVTETVTANDDGTITNNNNNNAVDDDDFTGTTASTNSNNNNGEEEDGDKDFIESILGLFEEIFETFSTDPSEWTQINWIIGSFSCIVIFFAFYCTLNCLTSCCCRDSVPAPSDGLSVAIPDGDSQVPSPPSSPYNRMV